MGHAARAFLPSGQVFASRRVTFFLRAQKKSNQKKTAPCGALRITRNPLGASLTCFPPARVAGRCAKLGACQHCSLHSTSCLRHEAFKRPYANFALLHVNPQVDKMQSKPGTPTALYSRLLKAGGWPQKLLLTRPKFRTAPRDPRWRKTSEGSPKRVASEAKSPRQSGFFWLLFLGTQKK